MSQTIPKDSQSAESTDRDLEQLLTAFADAWNRHDAVKNSFRKNRPAIA